jgi:hypothetical protein
MIRSSLALGAVLAVFGACGADTATQESKPRAPETGTPPDVRAREGAAAVVPENPADRAIRQELVSAIAMDPQLKNREISFLVSNGDVSVTGTVGTEQERRKINDMAMSIAGVKSVANAVRVEE